VSPIGGRQGLVDPKIARVIPGGVLIAGCVREVTFAGKPTFTTFTATNYLFFTLLDQQTGQFVTSFGNGGTTLVQLDRACVSSLVLQGDSMLAFGSQFVNGTQKMIKVKVFYNGTVDLAWGGGVAGASSFGQFLTESVCAYLALPDVVAVIGTFARSTAGSCFVVELLNAADGTVAAPRSSFGFDPDPNGGALGNSSIATACVRHPLGAVVASGLANGRFFAAMRFVFGKVANVPIVTLDPAFGNGGKLVTSIVSPRSGVKFVVPSIMPSGSLVLSGESGVFQTISEQSVRVLSSGQSWSCLWSVFLST
jgi:hypothetical protein